MESVDFRFMGHQRPLPLMTPRGSDPRVPPIILFTTLMKICDFNIYFLPSHAFFSLHSPNILDFRHIWCAMSSSHREA